LKFLNLLKLYYIHTYILHITRFFSRVWSNAHCVLKNLKQMNYYKNIWYLTIMY